MTLEHSNKLNSISRLAPQIASTLALLTGLAVPSRSLAANEGATTLKSPSTVTLKVARPNVSGEVESSNQTGPLLIEEAKKNDAGIITQYYLLPGTNLMQILAASRMKGPVERPPLLARHFACTYPVLHWKSTASQDPPGSVSAYHLTILTFPVAKDYDKLSPEQKKGWDTFSMNLAKHELGHVSLVREHIDLFLKRIGEQAAKGKIITPETLDETVREVSGMLSLATQEYDKKTQHGRTQGAWLSTE